jgi:NADP-reducing hydrogenase subunit HndB
MAKLSISDLKKIKEKVKGTVNLRDGSFRVKVTVHMGTCGIAAGARLIMSRILEEVEKSGSKDIILTSSGCAGLCSREPMMTVEVKGSPPVKYADLDADKASQVFQQHIMGGTPINEMALAMGSEHAY